jgi:hypothetical protein
MRRSPRYLSRPLIAPTLRAILVSGEPCVLEARTVFLRPVAAKTSVAKPVHYVHNIGHYSDWGMAKWMCLRIVAPWLLSVASAGCLKVRVMRFGAAKRRNGTS